MPYTRKTKDVWVIQFRYFNQPWEDISEANSREDKNFQLAKYRLSGGGEYRAVKSRVSIN